MDKFFICLANSYKRGGRCIAGVEIVFHTDNTYNIVRNSDGSPHWIRPIAYTQYGEIPNYIAEGIRLLSVVMLTNATPCPEGAHTENTHYSQMTAIPSHFTVDQHLLDMLVDPIHQSIFYNRGKAISAEMLVNIKYSLMLVRVENAQAYIDANREKSKNRLSFIYNKTSYDFPVTDSSFLELFRQNPKQFASIPVAYLSLSLGLEFEGWHHKLIAGIIIPPENTVQHTEAIEVSVDWFDSYETELTRLLTLKDEIEAKIAKLRTSLLQQMEKQSMDNINSRHFSISYVPARTVMQFDSRSFRADNKELYNSYCKPRQRDASIVVRRKTNDEK